MFFLLQTDVIDLADKISPVGYFVWGAFALVGYGIALKLWGEYTKQKRESTELMLKTTETLTKMTLLLTQIQNSSENTGTQQLSEIRSLNQAVSNLASTIQGFLQIRNTQ